MPTLTVISKRVKDRLKSFSPTLLRLVGLRLLTKAQTEELMRPYQVSYAAKPSLVLGAVYDVTDAQKELFHSKEIQTDPDFVWNYANTTAKATLLRSGNLNIANGILDTDFGNQALLPDLIKPDRRPVSNQSIVIAPWSHYWAGYYDFLLFVAGKLARIKTVLSPAMFAEAVVSYPLLHTSFESELMVLLGVPPERLLDSRQQAVRFERCILANNSSWFYPAAADVLALKSIVEGQLPPANSAQNRRIYISRKGRRRVVNEEALTAMLGRYGFEIIEDKPRSVIEQIELYRTASFIIGPHGASFANIIWCRPDTQLLEFFAPNYRPEYFRYLAQILNIKYAAYCLGPVADSHYTFVDADVEVLIEEVERGLINLLPD